MHIDHSEFEKTGSDVPNPAEVDFHAEAFIPDEDQNEEVVFF